MAFFILLALALFALFLIFIVFKRQQSTRKIENQKCTLMLDTDLNNQEEDLLTPEELVEKIFDDLENELRNNNLYLVCEELPDVWTEYQYIIQSVSALYQRYMNLRNYC